MNRVKALFLSETTDISNKLYVVFSAASILIVIGIFFINVLTSASSGLTVASWVMFFFQTISLLYSVFKNRFYLSSVLSCILINFIAFPYLFLTGHIFFGSVPIWMILGYTYTGLVLSKTTRTVMIFFQSIVNILCYIFSLSMDWNLIMEQYPYGYKFVDIWFAVVAGGAALFAMASFSKWLNSIEQKTIREQKDDIVTLYQNQNKFFSSMSHEIRTPINTIIGLNEVNLSLNPSEDIVDYATEIKFASAKLLGLINDILDISKLQSGKMEVVEDAYNLSDMISRITDDVWKTAYDRNLKLNIVVNPHTPVSLFGDEIRIRQIVRNLLINSIYTTDEGYVELQIRFEEVSESEINLIFEIEDTGRGVRRENIPYVFNIYRQTIDDNTSSEGTGLELPIAKSLSDIMGGKISVDSIYGHGSRYKFSVTQKIVTDNEAAATFENSGKNKVYSNYTTKNTKVLVVDDDGMNLNVFRKVFDRIFPDIDTATGGEDALALFKDNEYDLVFIDHLMPGMDGPTTLANMRKIREDVTSLALTANSGSDMRAFYLESGFTDYLAKPIDREYALRTIYKLLPREKIELSSNPDAAPEDASKVFEEQKRTSLIITTDSVSDIPDTYLKEYNIPIIPFYINTSEGKRYRDKVEISSQSLISFLNNNDNYAFSEAPTESEYEIFFGELLRNTDSIIHLSVAKNNSDGYKNACLASKSFSNVEVIDSGNVCFGLGVIAIRAAGLAASGAGAAKIKEQILKDKDDIKFDFVIDETRNLAATNRISLTVHKICSFLNIHPVIKLRDSRMVIRTLKFGDINKIRDRYYKNICKRRNISNDFIVLLHSNFDEDTLKRIEGELLERVPTDRFIVLSPGAAIASNCGRGAFGICYRRK